MSALGERFRAAREARGLSLSDVSEQTRIRSVYLAAIEDENWSAIGAPVYIRGFLRTYARFLGLDADDVVAEFSGAVPEAAPAVAAPAPASYAVGQSSGGRSLSPLIWVAAVVAVALIAFVFYNELTMHQRQAADALPSNTAAATAAASVAAAATPSPLASVSPAVAADAATGSPQAGESPQPSGSPGPSASPGSSASPGPEDLVLRFSAPSWIRVTVDGNVSMEGTFPAGTERAFHGKVARLRIGNAGGVEVIVGGKSAGALGKAGDVVERTFTL
jgi:cytoskeletal protein RodZ